METPSGPIGMACQERCTLGMEYTSKEMRRLDLEGVQFFVLHEAIHQDLVYFRMEKIESRY